MGKKKRGRGRGLQEDKDEEVQVQDQKDKENRDIQDELFALQVIYAPDIVITKQPPGFKLKVVPEFGKTCDNLVDCELTVEYPKSYPHEPVNSIINPSENLSKKDKDFLQDNLTATAQQCAGEGLECGLGLVILCQNYLQQCNDVVMAKQAKSKAQPQSLWHAMQQRQIEGETAGNSISVGLSGWLQGDASHFGSQLFGDIDGNRGARIVLKKQTPMNVKGVKEKKAVVKNERQPRGNVENLQSTLRTQILASSKHLKNSPFAGQPLSDEEREEDDDNSSSGSGDKIDERENSTSLLNSLMTGMSQLSRYMSLPAQLKQLLGGEDCNADDQTKQYVDIQERLRQYFLMGHMLLLMQSNNQDGVGGGGWQIPQGGLAPVVSHLQERGLLPRWLVWLMMHQPDLFERAFRRMFEKERTTVSQKGKLLDSQIAATLRNFWKADRTRNSTPSAAQRQGSFLVSRYRNDFEEESILGKGGFGVVVSAVNRLDGRKYAVKRIPLEHASQGYNARILREVSTLSRLQHPNVVRYFQAWCETVMEDEWQKLAEGSTMSYSGTQTTTTAIPSNVKKEHSQLQSSDLQLSPVLEHEIVFQNDSDSEHYGSASEDPMHDEDTEDDDDEESDSDDMSQPVQGLGVGRSSMGRSKQVLYIQMEYCPRTLKQFLDDGGIQNDDDGWHAARQLLAGLAHLHSQGIIHRDIKPANIFYDAKGDIKIGDFGLAKFTQVQSATDDEEILHSKQLDSLQQYDSTTLESSGVCGTFFYMSPEIVSGQTQYDEKVDIFSLGIVIFELWHPFSTGHHRNVVLQELSRNFQLPEAWDQKHPKIAQLVKWMTSPIPNERPTAREVLRCDLLPPRVADDHLNDLLRSLPDNPDLYDRVIDGLFMKADQLTFNSSGDSTEFNHQQNSSALCMDMPGAPKAVADLELQVSIVGSCREIFCVHGGVEMQSYDIGQQSIQNVNLDRSVCMLSKQGGIVSLRHEMRRPFAMWLADQVSEVDCGMEGLRRFEIGQVYGLGKGGSISSSHLQADFDIISAVYPGDTEGKIMCDAEGIRACLELLSDIKAMNTDYSVEVRVGHKRLLDSCLKQAKVPPELLTAVTSITPTATQERAQEWQLVLKTLVGMGIPEAQAAKCKKFLLSMAGEPEAALTKLLNHFTKANHNKAFSSNSNATQNPVWYQELQLLTQLLPEWGPLYNIDYTLTIDPFIQLYPEYFSGIYFQIYLQNTLICVGGRYDGLIRQLWPTGGVVNHPGAVGISLNIDRIVQILSRSNLGSNQEIESVTLQPCSSDVLVCARGSGPKLLRRRMQIVSLLWSYGIRAETLPMVTPRMQQQYQYANSHGIRWMVIVGDSDRQSADTVRVKRLDRRSEEDVPTDEVGRYLRQYLGDKKSTKSTINLPKVPFSEDEPENEKRTTGRKGNR